MKKIEPAAFGKVGVLYGGVSSERAVSLVTGEKILSALLKMGIQAEGVDVQPGFVPGLIEKNFDRVFIALHGTGGEDGSVQGLLTCLNIPFTGSGIAGSAISLDKVRSKQIWQALGLSTLPFVILEKNVFHETTWAKIGLSFPLCVKPVSQGSTVGITRATTLGELKTAFEVARGYDPVVLAEPWIHGEEYTVGILGDEPLPSIRIAPKSGFYNYESKYTKGMTEYTCPSGLNAEDEALIQSLSLDAFRALGCTGWGRVDLMRDQQGQFWLLEVNTVPGMTETSLVPQAAKVVGWSFEDLVCRILSFTLKD